MNQQNSSLRFDHKEIAVIFSLFVFVSLLMFTVGILVGKGLTQARYEGTLESRLSLSQAAPPTTTENVAAESDNRSPSSAGTSVSTDNPTPKTEDANTASVPKDGGDKVAEARGEDAPLKLIPQKPKLPESYDGSLQEPAKSNEVDKLMKDSKIRALVEDDPAMVRRNTASIPGKIPTSFSAGLYTVQVGSYTAERDATERVAALKKLGFPYAYFSVKELDDKKTKWFRVWLGYFSDYKTAKDSGQLLEQRGEVKNYLVRKTDTAG